MRVLIVGCGYVGLSLGRLLRNAGHRVAGLRRSGAGEAELRENGITPLTADITSESDLSTLRPDYEWVVNCVSASGGAAAAYDLVYRIGMENLLGWLRGSGVRKFAYTSSTGVYAQEDGSLVDESSAVVGAGETGKVLVEAERVILRAAEERQFPGVVARLSGIYGPGRGYWWRQFVSGEARLEGDGSRWLNMVHVADVTGAIVALLERGSVGGVYNITDNEPVRQRDLFAWLAKKLGKEMPVAEAAAGRRRGVSNKRVSNERLRGEIGYELVYPTFREGFQQEITTSVKG